MGFISSITVFFVVNSMASVIDMVEIKYIVLVGVFTKNCVHKSYAVKTRTAEP